MNRWNEWARQLRSRHGRRELRRSAAAMVFRRAPGARPMWTVNSAATIRLAVHAPIGAALRAVTAPPLQAHARPAAPAPILLTQPRTSLLPPAARTSRAEPLLSLPTASSAKFVHAHSAATLQTARMERPWLPVRELAAVWLRKPAVSAEAQMLSLRLRQYATRKERRPAELPKMSAPMRRETAVESAGPASRNAAPVEPRMAAPQATQAATAQAMNVEALTSQVIQQIDRRLIAYRERMGRV